MRISGAFLKRIAEIQAKRAEKIKKEKQNGADS